MTLGITNATNITIDQLSNMANSTSLPEFFLKVNYIVYDGYLFFILLFILMMILYFSAEQTESQPLTNLMFSSAICTVLALLLRAIVIIYEGVATALLTDTHMWVFPIISILLATVLWLTKE